MASYRYERDIDPKDIAPRKERQYTRKERWANWWDYNLKWVIIIGIAVAFVAYNFIGQYFFTTKADYNVAVVAPYYLPEDTVNALQTRLAPLGEDLNGDGKVVVTLNVYTLDYSDEDTQTESAAYLTMAGTTKLAADVQGGLSSVFLLWDPAGFEESTGSLRSAGVRQRRRLVEHGLQMDRLPRADGAGSRRLSGGHHPCTGRRQSGVHGAVLCGDARGVEFRHRR